MIPLYGFLEGDTIGLLILAREDETVAEVARRLVVSAAVRVPPNGNTVFVYQGRALDPRYTVHQAGLTALDRFDVRAEGRAHATAAAGGPGRGDGGASS